MKNSLQDINIVHAEYCPHCRIITNLKVSTIPWNVVGPDGEMKTLVLRTYHCESCCSFVRSEEVEAV